MAGNLVADAIQLGDGVAANNLVIKTNDDGSFQISRGNIGGALTPILSIDADGKMVQAWETGAGKQLFSGNGYQKLGNGLIIQWGLSAVIPDDSEITVNFPVAFPTACLNVTATVRQANFIGGGYIVFIDTLSNANFVMGMDDVATSVGGAAAYWIAIGY